MHRFLRSKPDSLIDNDRQFEKWFDQHYEHVYPEMKAALMHWQNPIITQEVLTSVNVRFNESELFDSDDKMATEMVFRLHQINKAILTQLKQQLSDLSLYTTFVNDDDRKEIVKILTKFTDDVKDMPRRKKELRKFLAQRDSNNQSPA
jgi:hypothetical protein